MKSNCSTINFSDEKQIREIINTCSSAALFCDVADTTLRSLLEQASIRDFNSGQMIVQQGEIPEYLYFIMEGTAKTLQYNEEGEEAVIRMLKKNETFMDAVIFMGGPSPVCAQIVENAKLLMIPVNSIKAHVMINGQFARNLLGIVSTHYKNAIEQVSSVVLRSPVERIGHYLLALHLEQGRESLEVILPFKKSMIAHHLGMQPETFSRALKQIKKSGIDIDGETITLTDAFSLCHFCDEVIASSCSRRGSGNCTMCNP
jgi:CRP-like cAMP-binding protein